MLHRCVVERPIQALLPDGARSGETTLVATLGDRRLGAGAAGERQVVGRTGCRSLRLPLERLTRAVPARSAITESHLRARMGEGSVLAHAEA